MANKKLKFHLKLIKTRLNPELNKINIHSIYKGILDIFTYVFDLNLNDTYNNNKVNNVISELNNFPENEKVKEF